MGAAPETFRRGYWQRGDQATGGKPAASSGRGEGMGPSGWFCEPYLGCYRNCAGIDRLTVALDPGLPLSFRDFGVGNPSAASFHRVSN